MRSPLGQASTARIAASLLVAALLATAARAAADEPAQASAAGDRVIFRAGRLDADARLDTVSLRDRVEIRHGRYRLESEALRLRFDRGAVVFDGDARMAFCPCPSPPLTIAASGGRFEPPGDLFLRFPRVEVLRVPIFALPYLWLRSPEQPGLLPPILALRGRDGVILGAGAHLPWRGDDGAARSLDVTIAGYFQGGAEIGARLFTPATTTRLVLDQLRGTRAIVDAHGSLAPDRDAPPRLGLSWDVDAIRGDRARSATRDLATAAQPFDRAAAEVSLRAGSGAIASIFAGGLAASALRGEGAIAFGPRAAVALGGALGRVGSWSADAGGAVLGEPATNASLPLAGASLGGELDARPGPLELRFSSRARARVAGDLPDGPPSHVATVALRADVELPLVRVYAAAPGDASVAHWITPALSLQGALASQRGAFFTTPSRSPFALPAPPISALLPPASLLAAAGAWTAIGRYAGPSLRLDLRAGAAVDDDGADALVHARLAFDARIAAGEIEAAAVPLEIGRAPAASLPSADPVSDAARGLALVARARFGAEDGPFVRVDLASQRGASARAARAIAPASDPSVPGADRAWIATLGTSLGGEVSVPWLRVMRTALRADTDLDAGELLAIRGSTEYRHACGCLSLGLLGAHRVGRRGVDLLFTASVVPVFRGQRHR